MPPDNSHARKSRESVGIAGGPEEGRPPAKCHSCEGSPREALRASPLAQSKSQTDVKAEEDPGEGARGAQPRGGRVSSLLGELLCDIYAKMEAKRRTSATTCDLGWQDSDHGRCSRRETRGRHHWSSKDASALRAETRRLERLIAEEGSNLVKHLKRKNFLLARREAHYDVITAYIQAFSAKTREDTKMKFSLSPGAETGFSQWVDAMKMVAQLPGGMPPEFRTKLWLQLSEKHLSDRNVDWEKAEAVIFNEWTNPDDEELGVQIVKDLHRTGCSLFCGEHEHNQALLKRVLLAYARWNKNVGYCQGFNMLAALILQVMDKDEKNAVKVMIYLIEGVLPESYFANNLRGLSVDMAVFRDLLRLRLPKLSKHLEALQHDTNAGTSYEPPLTNVFTMQWFLTLFSNCLPQQTVLRVWDLVFLYGNEVLLRTALAIWGILQERVITVESADEFYSIMGVVTREMLEFGLMDANTLVKTIAMVDPFPNELQELREKYLYNISPWAQSVQSAAKKGIRLFYGDADEQDDTEDEDKIALATAYGVFRRRESASRELQVSGPTLDISVLKQQYAKLRQRQRQAHVIITAACSSSLPGNLGPGPGVSVNHLLMGKSALVNKGRRIGPPEGSIPPSGAKKGDDREGKKPKVVISGETFHWKDAEKKRESNQRGKAEDGAKTNHDRTGVSEESVEESLRRKEDREGSSGSSTSTELCDEEFHPHGDLDSDEATASDVSPHSPVGGLPRLPPHPPESPRFLSPRPSGGRIPLNGGCDSDNLREIKDFAVKLVDEIEEKLQTSEKLNRTKEPDPRRGRGEEEEEEVTVEKFDNTKNVTSLLDADIQFFHDNILKAEPEVPISPNVIERRGVGASEGEEGRKIRRKSDLGLNVIRENLEMLSKFSQRSFEAEKTTGEQPREEKKREDAGGEGPPFPHPEKKQVQESLKTEESFRPAPNFLVEKAISPIAEKASRTEKVNKEVNTEITFGVEEVEISTRSKLVKENESKFKPDEFFREEKEILLPETSRKSRETFYRGKDEIKRRIETSKSDWELKMRKIAELETTTREALNEIQARSRHRKSLHRSLDRSTRRSCFDSEFESSLAKIDLESTEESSDRRKSRISALSFDAITSRTEKLLNESESNRTSEETSSRRILSPERDLWKPRDSTSKFKRLIEESYGEEAEMKETSLFCSKSHGFYSSPTSPEHRSRYPDYLSPRKCPPEERTVENGSKTSFDKRKYSPERWKPDTESESHPSKSNFNPFPRRSPSRPKELGVKLGLYPTSPEAGSKKS